MNLSDKDLFAQIEKLFIGSIDTFWEYGVNLLNAVEPIFAICFGIYLLLWVLNYWANPSFTNMGIDFVKKCIAWSIVIALAFNAGNYKSLASAVYKLGDELSSIVVNGGNHNQNTTAIDSIRNSTNEAIADAYTKGDEAFSGLKNSGKHLTFNAAVFCSHMMLTFIIGIIFALYLSAKMCLLLALVVAPFYIGCLLFEGTRQWGMNYINTAFSFVLTIVLYTAIVALLNGIFTNHIVGIVRQAMSHSDTKVLMGSILALPTIMLLMCVVFIIVLNRIPSITSAITGGNVGGGGGATAIGGYAAGKLGGASVAAGGKAWGATKATGRGIGRGAAWAYRKFRGGNSVSGD